MNGMQRNLTMAGSTEYEEQTMPDADVRFYPSLFTQEEADELLRSLERAGQEIKWEQEKIKISGKEHDLPRLTAWYGDSKVTYTYSGKSFLSRSWTPTLLLIKEKIEAVSGVTFNGVLLNLYRDGSDGVSWHSDDELELGRNPVIGSVSLGMARDFQMKHKTKTKEKRTITLTHGSYLLMRGPTQHHWLHQIPKNTTTFGERINLTFRGVRGKRPIPTHQ